MIKVTTVEKQSFLELPEDWEIEVKKEYGGTWRCTCQVGKHYHKDIQVSEYSNCKTEAVTNAIRKSCMIADCVSGYEP